jgi:hypothetical protein
MPYVILVGDSVFDNARYVTGPDVTTLVKRSVPADWSVSLLAVDGSYLLDVPRQLSELPEDAALLVVSAGGNDAVAQIEILSQPASSVGAGLLVLSDVIDQYRKDYTCLLESVLATKIRSYLCTIYRPNFPDRELQRITSTVVGLFNDVIVEEGWKRGLPILDLRRIFTDERDYATPIEPSVEGGRKLAIAIASLLDPETKQE